MWKYTGMLIYSGDLRHDFREDIRQDVDGVCLGFRRGGSRQQNFEEGYHVLGEIRENGLEQDLHRRVGNVCLWLSTNQIQVLQNQPIKYMDYKTTNQTQLRTETTNQSQLSQKQLIKHKFTCTCNLYCDRQSLCWI